MNHWREPSNSDPDPRELVLRGTAAPPGPVYSYQAQSINEPRSQLLEYWDALRRKLVMVGLLAAVGAGAGFLVAMLQHPLYRARTVLDIRNLNENLLNVRDGGGAGTGMAGTGLPESYLQTEIKILQSESILKRALDRMPKLQITTPGDKSLLLFSGLVRVPGPKQGSLSDLVADASRRIKVRALGNTRIVEILCDGRDGQIAANMCNNLALTYIAYNMESRHESTSETGQWLKSQLESVRLRLTQSEAELKDSARESTLVFNSELDNPAQDRLRQLQAELSRAQAERISKQSEYEVLMTSAADALPLALDAGPIREYRMRLAELHRQVAEMSEIMKPEHYRVREVKSQITQFESALEKERKDLLSRMRTDYEAAERRETMLKAAYDRQIGTVSEHGDKAVRYEMLKRDVDSTRKLYEALLQRVEEVNLANAMRASTISIVDKAIPPTVPYSPNWPVSTGIGLFGGGCLGVGLAVVCSRSDRTLRDPGEAPSQLHIRELGVIPSARSGSLSLLLSKVRSDRPANGHTTLLSNGAGSNQKYPTTIRIRSDQAVELATWRGDQPLVAEAFCGAMNSLLFASVGGARARVIVLTSPDIGDGKTAVATNLAIALARTGRRVALVDGDLRQPRLHKVFDLDTGRGLASLLRGSEPVEELPDSALALPTAVDGLFVLPTAPAKGPDVSALLHSDRLSTLIRHLRGGFDVVLIDTPPMTLLSDARVVGALADGVLLVFRAGKTTRESAFAAQHCLRQDGIAVLGTVLNDWNARKSKTYAKYLRHYAHSANS
jgi:succinoglycan biosynthesis transport protein ExoP